MSSKKQSKIETENKNENKFDYESYIVNQEKINAMLTQQVTDLRKENEEQTNALGALTEAVQGLYGIKKDGTSQQQSNGYNLSELLQTILRVAEGQNKPVSLESQLGQLAIENLKLGNMYMYKQVFGVTPNNEVKHTE